MLFIKKHPDLIATVILAVFFVVSLIVSSQESTTMDEKAHIPSGYSYVLLGDMRLNPEHPPLLKDLAGLPLLILRPNFPISTAEWTSGINEQWVMGDKLLHLSGNDAQAITFWARFPIILIALLLGFALYRFVGRFLGTGAGLFALTLYAADPNILGHNHLVTTDLGIAAFIFFATLAFLRWVKDPTLKNTLLFGFFFGLVELAKFSAVILFPFYFILAIVYGIAQSTRTATTNPALPGRFSILWDYTWKYAIAILVAFLVIAALYWPNTINMPADKVTQISESVFKADNIAAHTAKVVVAWMATTPGLKGLSEYFLGVFMVFARVAGGNTYYFLGTVSNHATKVYFPMVFVLKETLPFLALLIFALGTAFLQLVRGLRDNNTSLATRTATYITSHIESISMMSFVVFYAYLSITSNLNIGFRHLFPMLPFLYVFATKAVWDTCRTHRDNHTEIHQVHRRLHAILTGAFIFWIVAIPVLAYPHYISYFNESVGGHQNGYQYVTDSNYDWGQDIIRLRQWVDTYNSCVETKSVNQCLTSQLDLNPAIVSTLPQTSIDTLRIDYFGGSSPEYYFGSTFKSWHGESAPEPGWYAISAGFYQESSHKPEVSGQWSYRWLKNYPMVGRAGDSIFLFYVPAVK